jgi:hypothetical protein
LAGHHRRAPGSTQLAVGYIYDHPASPESAGSWRRVHAIRVAGHIAAPRWAIGCAEGVRVTPPLVGGSDERVDAVACVPMGASNGQAGDEEGGGEQLHHGDLAKVGIRDLRRQAVGIPR